MAEVSFINSPPLAFDEAYTDSRTAIQLSYSFSFSSFLVQQTFNVFLLINVDDYVTIKSNCHNIGTPPQDFGVSLVNIDTNSHRSLYGEG